MWNKNKKLIEELKTVMTTEDKRDYIDKLKSEQRLKKAVEEVDNIQLTGGTAKKYYRYEFESETDWYGNDILRVRRKMW